MHWSLRITPFPNKNELLLQKSDLDNEVINKGKLPKKDLNVQSTYYYHVTQLPISLLNVTINPPNKDQYKAILDINQLLYNGGLIDSNAKIKEVQTKTQQQQLEVSLYQLKTRINQLYFSTLLLQERTDILLVKDQQLGSKIKEMKVGVKYGAILPTSEKVLEAEKLKIKQQLTEIRYDKKRALENLSTLTYSAIDEKVTLKKPKTATDFSIENNRTELKWFDLQNKQINLSKNLLAKNNLPKLNAFGQAGYGNPGLNMLDNSFQTFYVLGIKANWNLFDWNKSKTEQYSIIDFTSNRFKKKESFSAKNLFKSAGDENEIIKAEEVLTIDSEIIALKEFVVKYSDTYLIKGFITAPEYLAILTNLF